MNSWVVGQNFTDFDTKFLDESFDLRQTILFHSISSNKTTVFSTIHSLNSSLVTVLFSTQYLMLRACYQVFSRVLIPENFDHDGTLQCQCGCIFKLNDHS